MADYISAFAFTSVCVCAHLLSAGQKVCEGVKSVGGLSIIFTPQSGMCILFVAFCQIDSCGKLLVR